MKVTTFDHGKYILCNVMRLKVSSNCRLLVSKLQSIEIKLMDKLIGKISKQYFLHK